MALQGALRGLADLMRGIVCVEVFEGLRLACGVLLPLGL